MKKFYCTTAVCLLLVLFIPALPLHSQTNEWKAYSGGLARIQKMVDDGNYLWLATYGGLVKFDKLSQKSLIYDKTNSGLPAYIITDMAVDADNTLWMTTERGLTRFDGTTWTTFNTDNAPLPSPYIYALAIHGNDVWVATDKGLAHYNGTDWEVFNDTPDMPWLQTSILHIDNKGLLLIPYGDTVYTYSGTTWASVSMLPQGVSSATLIGNARNATWILGRYQENYPQRHFLVSSTDGNWQQHDVTPLDTHIVTAMAIGEDVMWFATQSGMVFRCKDSQWSTYTIPLKKDIIHEEFHDQRITTMLIDDNGIVWCGTNFYKIFRSVNNALDTLTYTPIQLPPARASFRFTLSLSSLAVDIDQSLWVGYADFFPATSPITHVIGDSIYNEYVPPATDYLAVDSKGRKWAASGAGLWTLEKGTWLQLSDKIFTCIYIDRNDNIWLGSREGVSKYDHASWTEYPLDNSIGSPHIHSIVQDRNGTMWCAGHNKLFAFDGTTWNTYTHESTPALYYPQPSALTCDSSGVLWMGMQGSRFDTTALVSFDGTTWTTYTKYNSPLPNNTVNALITDKTGALYISTDYKNITKLDHGIWTTFTPDNSPLISDFGIDCLALDSSNNLWIGINTGTHCMLLAYREGGVLVGVEEQTTPPHHIPLLQQNMPNPVATHTTFRYSVPETTVPLHVRLQLFNALGVHIATLADGYKTAGTYTAEFDASTLASGTYYYQLSIGNTTQAKQMLVVR